MAEVISSTTSIGSFYVGSPEDAVHVLDAVQFTLTDNIRNSLQQNVSAAARLVTTLQQIGNATSAMYKGLSPVPTPVTVDTLEATPPTSTALSSLFLADGPMLGDTLAEANQTFALLTDMGIPIHAPVQTPVLVVTDNMDGSATVKSFAWYSDEQLKTVKSLTDVRTSPYPGSTAYVKTIENGSGKVTQTVTYTTFDDYANRRTTTTDSFTHLVLLVNLAFAIQVQLALELANLAKQADKLDDEVESHRNAVKQEASSISRTREERDQQLAEALRQLRVLKAEREALRERASHRVERVGGAKNELEHGLQLGHVIADAVRDLREGRGLHLGQVFREQAMAKPEVPRQRGQA